MNTLFLIVLLCLALWTVVTTHLMKSVVGLAMTSVMLSVILFRMEAPMAAVFELSVCAGLIPVFFITAVAFTRRISKDRDAQMRKSRQARFWLLPVLLALVGALLWKWPLGLGQPVAAAVKSAGPPEEVSFVLWNLRRFDLLGQILVLLAGAWGVCVFFKERQS